MVRVVRATRTGEVLSYGQVAVMAGRPGAARAVGSVLAASQGLPWCHPRFSLPAVGMRRPAAAVIVAAGLVVLACSGPQGAMPAAPAASAPSPSAATAGWTRESDPAIGLSFSRPSAWIQVISMQSLRAYASRDGIANLRDVSAGDTWFVIRTFAPDPTIRCADPADPQVTKATTLGGASATYYERTGIQDRATSVVFDVIGTRNSRCVQLSLTAGRDAVTEDRSIIEQIRSSLVFNPS